MPVLSGQKIWFPGKRDKNGIQENARKDIQKLIQKGVHDLPIAESPNTKAWLERLSGIVEADNGVYYYEQGDSECKFLIYDRDSHTLFYYLSII